MSNGLDLAMIPDPCRRLLHESGKYPSLSAKSVTGPPKVDATICPGSIRRKRWPSAGNIVRLGVD